LAFRGALAALPSFLESSLGSSNVAMGSSHGVRSRGKQCQNLIFPFIGNLYKNLTSNGKKIEENSRNPEFSSNYRKNKA